MSPIAIAAIVMVATCAAAAIGLIAQRFLPEHHLGSETKDTVRLAIGTVTAMTALVLGLATASAKNTYDLTCRNVHDASIDLITIDRMLRRYGDEAAGIRADVEQMMKRRLAWLTAMGRGRWKNTTRPHPQTGSRLRRIGSTRSSPAMRGRKASRSSS